MEKDNDRKIISLEYRSEQFFQATMEVTDQMKGGVTLLGVLSELQEKLQKREGVSKNEWLSATALLNEKAKEAGFLAKGIFDLLCPTMVYLDLNPVNRGKSASGGLLSWLKRNAGGNLDTFFQDDDNLRSAHNNLTALLFLSAHLATEKAVLDIPGSESAIAGILSAHGLNPEEPGWSEMPTDLKDCRSLLGSLDSDLELFRLAACDIPNVGHSFDYD